MRIQFLPLLLALGLPGVAAAQGMIQALPGSSDADLLAATMRRVAANPLDLDALLTAGEQSLRVDDLSGAASLFARAEKIDPRSGRMKAGMASILVRSERPGEALRYFAQAEAAGLDPRRFAADRGFAYDLVGDQPRAQRDYRLALAGGAADDETVRRYALSLGISGKGEEAQRQLQPLLGRSDRAAWRARAFILAMVGDQSGAERIAATMMPAGMAQGLRPFFERLPALPAVDRAFAVHFGEVRATPERLADARLAPGLAPLPAEPRPVQVAAVAVPTPVPVESRRDRQRRERDERHAARERTALAARTTVAPGRVTLASRVSLPPAAAVVTAPVQVASLAPTPGFPTALLPMSAPAPAAAARVVPAPIEVASAMVPTIASPSSTGLAPLIAEPAAIAAAMPVVPATRPASSGVALAAVPGASSRAAATLPPARTPRRGTRAPTADSVLARIVASLSIPAAELGVTPPVRAQPAAGAMSEGAARTAEAVRTKAARDAEADAVAQRLARGRPADTKRTGRRGAEPVELADAEVPVTRSGRTRTAEATRTARRGAEPVEATETEQPARSARGTRRGDDAAADAAKRVDSKKALADRRAAAEKKAAADKAAEERRASRAHPSRIWVQVAGGAYEGDLPKAWAATRAKAPQVFAGRAGYSAKLRATNRVVTGPFKTDAEARAFVNQLAKSGVSAFPFTSDAGETVARLPGK